jgi:hypothetical protein
MVVGAIIKSAIRFGNGGIYGVFIGIFEVRADNYVYVAFTATHCGLLGCDFLRPGRATKAGETSGNGLDCQASRRIPPPNVDIDGKYAKRTFSSMQ